MPLSSSPRKRARPQQVYERLRALIIDGRLAVGEMLDPICDAVVFQGADHQFRMVGIVFD